MVRGDSDKVECRTPNPDRPGTTKIPAWKFDCVAKAIKEALKSAGSAGLAFSALPDAVGSRLAQEDLNNLGSLGWHVTTVKLELEVRGEIERLPGSPQRLRLRS